MNYLGIDHHRQFSRLTLMDEKGNILQSGNVINSRPELEAFFEDVEDRRAVIEASRSSYTLVDMLTECKGDTMPCRCLVGSAPKDDSVEDRQGQGIMSPKVIYGQSS